MKLITYPNEPERNVAELGKLSKTLESRITEIADTTSGKDVEKTINDIVPPMIDSAIAGLGGGSGVIIERLI